MKHIFTIHSHITFLAALGTIAKEEINASKVILICTQGYKPSLNEKFKGDVILSLDDTWATLNLWQKLKWFNYSNFANSYIKEHTKNDDFIAYIDIMSVFNRYLVMYPNCKQFHVIEEGIVNYSDYDDFELFTADLRDFKWQWTGLHSYKEMLNSTIRLFRGRSLRILALPIHPNVYLSFKGVNAYCFSDYAFKNVKKDKKVLLDWNSTFPYVKEESYDFEPKSWFWIGDALSSFYGISMEHFRDGILHLMEEVNPNKEKRKLYLKFRGPESDEERKITIDVLTKYNFTIEFIDSATIMELVFLKGKEYSVCGISSSLLIYANLMGHATYSMLKNIPDEYNVSVYSSYSTIAKKVGFIK